jgi:hypothetical protein
VSPGLRQVTLHPGRCARCPPEPSKLIVNAAPATRPDLATTWVGVLEITAAQIRGGHFPRYSADRILARLTLAGAIYITLVCLLPEFLVLKYNVPFYFGGTSLLIIVVVTMDFWAQVQSYVMSQQYESLLKKANFKGS